MPLTSLAQPFKISVIIATKDRHNVILDCLLSICRQTYLPFEIIVVDSSENDKTKDELKRIPSSYLQPVYLHTRQQSSSLQRNIGAKASSGDLLAFFDDDMVLNPDFLEKITPIFSDKNKKIGGATGRITNEIHPRWTLVNVFRFLTFFSYPSYGEIRISGFHTEYNWCDKPLKVEWLYGYCVYRRNVFNTFLFDENLKGYAYNEDLDLSYRISREYECWYIPEAKVIHNKDTNRLSPKVARAVVLHNYYLLNKNILPNKSVAMKFLHLTTFYIAIFSFLLFLLLTFKFKIFKGGMLGLGEIWFKKD